MKEEFDTHDVATLNAATLVLQLGHVGLQYVEGSIEPNCRTPSEAATTCTTRGRCMAAGEVERPFYTRNVLDGGSIGTYIVN